jgi:hypothetical protein
MAKAGQPVTEQSCSGCSRLGQTIYRKVRSSRQMLLPVARVHAPRECPGLAFKAFGGLHEDVLPCPTVGEARDVLSETNEDFRSYKWKHDNAI